MTQVGGTGFNGTIQFDGLRKSGFSPGFSSYMGLDYTTISGGITYYMWGTTPSAPMTPNTSPYFSNDEIASSVGVLAASGGFYKIKFADDIERVAVHAARRGQVPLHPRADGRDDRQHGGHQRQQPGVPGRDALAR